MLRIILISIIWGICSTPLIRPYFWISIIEQKKEKKEDTYKEAKKKGRRMKIWIHIAFFLITFLISMEMYICTQCRQNMFAIYPVMLIICSFFQKICINQKQNLWVKLLLLILLVFWCVDWIQIENIETCTNYVDEIKLAENAILLPHTISSLFNMEYEEGPLYINNKYIYKVSKKKHNKALVMISAENPKIAKLIPYFYDENDIQEIRNEYPTKVIKKLQITVLDDNTPVGVYAIAEKTNIFKKYDVKEYLYVNLITGKRELK